MKQDWDDLRYFLALSRCRTIAPAARLLGVSEITVRRRIARLEEQYGVSVFEYIGGVYELTTAGRHAAETAQAIEATLGRGWERLLGNDKLPQGHVRVGAPDGIGNLRVGPALGALQMRLPQLTIELITLPRQADLSRHEVDIALVPMRPEGGGGHHIRALKPVTVRLYAARSYLDAHPPIQSLSDLAGHRFVGYPLEADFRQPINEIARQLGIDYPASLSSMSIIGQALAVAQGAGFALLPTYAAEMSPGLLPVLPEEVTAHVPLWLMIHREMTRLPRVREVVTAIVNALSGKVPTALQSDPP